jgi:hypothetical protein
VHIAIERCQLNGHCTQRWEALEPVRDNPRMRFCGQCQTAIHLAEHAAELFELTRLGKSVALVHKTLLYAT